MVDLVGGGGDIGVPAGAAGAVGGLPADPVGVGLAAAGGADGGQRRPAPAGHVADQAVWMGLEVALVDVGVAVEGDVDAVAAQQPFEAVGAVEILVGGLAGLVR